jgi:hypothetical protein
MVNSCDLLIRKIEATVLDQEHKKYAITRRPDDVAIPNLLRALGGVDRVLSNTELSKEAFLKQRSFMQEVLSGVGHCLRWISQEPTSPILLLDNLLPHVAGEARDLLSWGIEYARLAHDHAAWSRGNLNASLDPDTKVISFDYRADFDHSFLISQAAGEERSSELFFQNFPYEDIQNGFRTWLRNFDPEPVIGRIGWRVDQDEGCHLAISGWLDRAIWPELPPETGLGAYTLGDFRRLYTTLFLIGQYCAWVEDYMDARYGVEGSPDSVIMSDTEQNMIDWLCEASGVARRSVRGILRDLLFDTSDFNSSLGNQPFAGSRSSRLFLLARLIPVLEPSRMLAGALSRGKGKPIYDALVQILEQSNLGRIEQSIRDLGFAVFREKRISYDTGEIRPDLLVLDRRDGELLIIDYKHMLAPFSVSETLGKLRVVEESDEGVTQVHRYLRVLRNNPPLLDGKLVEPSRIYGLLLFGGPMPLPIKSDPIVSVIDWVSLRDILSKNSGTSIRDLVTYVRNRPDLSTDMGDWRQVYYDIKVEGWTYRHPIMACV